MAINERQNKMLTFLKEEKRASIKSLAARFFVSEMTVRRDLKALEEQGYIALYSGGALYLSEYEDLPIDSRKILHSAEKRKISEKAKSLLSNSLTVFIASSSTTLYMIPILAEFKDITVVTNSVQCLIAAAKHHIKCIIAGGAYYAHDMCTIGAQTEEFLCKMNVDIGFFSAKGLSDDGIISDDDEFQTAARRAIMKNCKKKFFLFDSTKQHKKFLYTLCTTDEIDGIFLYE